MVRIGILPAVLALASISAMTLVASAQNPREVTAEAPKLMRVSPNQNYLPVPNQKESPKIQFRSVDQMSEEDRNLEATSQSAILKRAAFWGMEFNQGKWDYRQVVCPTLPNHLFLRFTRDQGAGDISMFTASIPRQGGEVRLMPLIRRSYSLFSPAPVNALTVSTFNHVLTEENAAGPPDWLALSLCYAALAGADPEITFPQSATEEPGPTFPAWTPVVSIPIEGGAVVQFTNIASRPQPMQWTLTFDPKGKLVKAAHEANTVMTIKEIHNEPAELQAPAINSTTAPQPDPAIGSVNQDATQSTPRP